MSEPVIANRFDVPSAIISGGGSRHKLGGIAKELGASRVLIVTDPGVVELGVAGEIEGIIRDAGLAVSVFQDVQPDPTDANVTAGVAALQEHGADLVVAVGGGSPIDTAKVVAIRPTNRQPLSDYMGLHKITHPGVPLIAVPTTAGTGSEATKVAVITDTERDVKMMMLSAPLLPRIAIVDFELSLSMPKELTAAVGVDTLTHGMEAFVSKKSNPMTDPLALSCIELVSKHLKRAWTDPNDHDARGAMMLAACQGGMAFSNSSVCLVHGMSRPIGAVFHLAHGLSNAILLPTVTSYSWTSASERYATIAHTLGCADAATKPEHACGLLVEYLQDLNTFLELPRLSRCRGVTRGIFERNVEKMASDAIASGSPANNPREPSSAEIVKLYNEAW
jgi:alcohol dehydrogenase class IV